jgi:hypothetical protein
MNCTDYWHYKAIFDEKNIGLAEFINGDPRRPSSEPPFLPFIDKYSDICNSGS